MQDNIQIMPHSYRFFRLFCYFSFFQVQLLCVAVNYLQVLPGVLDLISHRVNSYYNPGVFGFHVNKN